METRYREFGISAPRLVLLTTMFILLSVSSLAEDEMVEGGRRCFWCGPLAEQVHRSARALSCDSNDLQVTTCESGFNYCATVATAPPYVESRYCVKLYQDECYPLFCNTTGSWKMACPCQGDLCNGINTDREIEAFQVLPRLVAKTQNRRLKKRKTRFIRNANADDGSLNKITETPDNITTTVADVNINEITTQSVVEGNMPELTSQKPSETMESTSISVTINNIEYTVTDENKASDGKTINILKDEKVKPVTEPVDISNDVATEKPTIAAAIPSLTGSNNVVITENSPSVVPDNKPKDDTNHGKVEAESSSNDDNEMQSDEPSKEMAVDTIEKKETKPPTKPEIEKEMVTTPVTLAMTTATLMTTTESVPIIITPATNNTQQQKSSSQSLHILEKNTVLFHLFLLVIII